MYQQRYPCRPKQFLCTRVFTCVRTFLERQQCTEIQCYRPSTYDGDDPISLSYAGGHSPGSPQRPRVVACPDGGTKCSGVGNAAALDDAAANAKSLPGREHQQFFRSFRRHSSAVSAGTPSHGNLHGMHLSGNSSLGGKFSVSMLDNTPENREFATLMRRYSEMPNALVKGELSQFACAISRNAVTRESSSSGTHWN